MVERYSRQILFHGIGADGQESLARSRVLLVGCGALGSVAAEILVRAGVGRLTIADRDYIDESNLQRQSLFTETDCLDGLPKAVAAARHLHAINSGVPRLRVPQIRISGREPRRAGPDSLRTQRSPALEKHAAAG